MLLQQCPPHVSARDSSHLPAQEGKFQSDTFSQKTVLVKIKQSEQGRLLCVGGLQPACEVRGQLYTITSHLWVWGSKPGLLSKLILDLLAILLAWNPY